MTMARKSHIDLTREYDNFPYFNNSNARTEALANYYEFKLQGFAEPLGHIPTAVAQKFPITKDWRRDDVAKELVFQPQGEPTASTEAFEYRNKVMAAYLQGLREQKVFEVLAGWRDELYPIYGPHKNIILCIERSATPLFGVVSYGVHMTAFVRTPQGMKIWIPKRSETKQTYPGMMDNTVAGGLGVGEMPGECLIRESLEEASLTEDVASQAKACGIVTYHFLRTPEAGGEVGLSQPECEYIYDLELPESVIPQPNDQEAVDFRALTVAEVEEALATGKFKPNCALVLLDFFIRHGIITPENEPYYLEIVSRLHRRIEYPTI